MNKFQKSKFKERNGRKHAFGQVPVSPLQTSPVCASWGDFLGACSVASGIAGAAGGERVSVRAGPMPMGSPPPNNKVMGNRRKTGTKQQKSARVSAPQAAMQRRQAEHGEVMKAITMVQKFLRRKRWYKLIGTKIPLVEGPCGLRFVPIYNSAMKLEGVQRPAVNLAS